MAIESLEHRVRFTDAPDLPVILGTLRTGELVAAQHGAVTWVRHAGENEAAFERRIVADLRMAARQDKANREAAERIETARRASL